MFNILNLYKSGISLLLGKNKKKSIFIQNMFNNHDHECYLWACKPTGEIRAGEFIILDIHHEIEIMDIEVSLFGSIMVFVKKDSLPGHMTYDQLYHKSFRVKSRSS